MSDAPDRAESGTRNPPTPMYGLPETVQFCKRCVISNQRPSSTVEWRSRADEAKSTIGLDEEGVCSACRYADMKANEIDWEAREQELRDLCSQIRSRAGNYDCIVPGSGGKDSAFTSHVLKTRFGLHPLTVTWAPHLYTEIGFQNFQNWIAAGFDNVLITPNGHVHRMLTRLAFENLLHPFQPFIVGQRQVGPKLSAMHGIPTVFYGENQAEYGNALAENFSPIMDKRFYAAEPDPDTLVLGGVTGRDLMDDHGLNRSDLQPYLPADPAELDRVGTEVHYLGYYLRWDPQECYYYATEHTGFRANDERTEGSYSKYSSIDDRIDPLHYYTTFIKFGIGRATYDAAQEIRNGKIDREEGVALVRRYDHEVPERYLDQMLEYMGITRERFWEVIDRGRSPHLWERDGNEWKLRHAAWMGQHT